MKHTHNLPLDWIASLLARYHFVKKKSLPDRIRPGEKTVRQKLVNDRHTRTRCGVLFVEVASFCDLNSQRIGVVGRDHLQSRTRAFGRIRERWLAHDTEARPVSWTTHGRTRRHGDFRQVPQGPNMFEPLLVVSVDVIRCVKTFVVNGQTKREHAIGVDAEIDAREVPKSA